MSENKRYSADKMREVADMFNSATNPIAVCFFDKDGWHPNYIECHVERMLRQAADAEEENATLRTDADLYKGAAENWERRAKQAEARLEAVQNSLNEHQDCHKCKSYPHCDGSGCICAVVEITNILRAARGESENENK